MKTRPQPKTKKYYNYIDNLIPFIQSKLPVRIYGLSGYQLAFYWIMENGDEYPEPNHAPIEIFEKLIGQSL